MYLKGTLGLVVILKHENPERNHKLWNIGINEIDAINKITKLKITRGYLSAVKFALILLPFLTVTQHESGTRKKYLGQ